MTSSRVEWMLSVVAVPCRAGKRFSTITAVSMSIVSIGVSWAFAISKMFVWLRFGGPTGCGSVISLMILWMFS